MINICIFCGSSLPKKGDIISNCEDIIKYLVSKGFNIVYGGSKSGLMGVVADTALKGGGKVTGVYLDFFLKTEKPHCNLTELITVNSFSARKEKMLEISDCFLILPGGYGTLDEFFEVVTMKQVGMHNKKIIFMNICDYWSDFLKSLENMYDNGLFNNHQNLYEIAGDKDGLVNILL